MCLISIDQLNAPENLCKDQGLLRCLFYTSRDLPKLSLQTIDFVSKVKTSLIALLLRTSGKSERTCSGLSQGVLLLNPVQDKFDDGVNIIQV